MRCHTTRRHPTNATLVRACLLQIIIDTSVFIGIQRDRIVHAIHCQQTHYHLEVVTKHQIMGMCSHCDEKFTQGHKYECKHLFNIKVIIDEYDTTPMDDIQPRSGKTLYVYIDVNDSRLTTLLDSDSTHNLVDMEETVRMGLTLQESSGLCVIVANGNRLTSPSCCLDLCVLISCELFDINCYGLALGSYDMVLGVQWLKFLGPILQNFGHHTMCDILAQGLI
jgi:hypothetical protein